MPSGGPYHHTCTSGFDWVDRTTDLVPCSYGFYYCTWKRRSWGLHSVIGFHWRRLSVVPTTLPTIPADLLVDLPTPFFPVVCYCLEKNFASSILYLWMKCSLQVLVSPS